MGARNDTQMSELLSTTRRLGETVDDFVKRLWTQFWEVTDADTLTKDTQQSNRSTVVVGHGAVEGKPNEAAPFLFWKDGLHRGD